jgi:hypothetical protein
MLGLRPVHRSISSASRHSTKRFVLFEQARQLRQRIFLAMTFALRQLILACGRAILAYPATPVMLADAIPP